MTFEEFLTKRRVNVAAFAAGEPLRFAEWQNWFGQMHPESFYQMVKMVLNDVRRNYWLAEVPKPAAAPETATTTRPATRRAAISKPAAPVAETAKPEIPTKDVAKPAAEISETKPTEVGTSEETTAKPARPVFKPRAVIKKPVAPSENQGTEKPAQEKPAETKNPGETKTTETEKSATETPETAPAKPARPRAVIKRPAALSKAAENPEKTAAENPETVGNAEQKVKAQDPPEALKPARPRPVFKRPTTAATSETEKTVADQAEKVVNPVAIPGQEGASETKAISEEIQQDPEAAKAAEEVSAAVGHVPKPPRPRPVFKRPIPATNAPEDVAAESEKTVSETAQKPEATAKEITSEKPAETVGDSDQKPENKTVGSSDEKVEKPTAKPPRPRPIFKRPAKPESDDKNSQHL
ncbi:hypothetical protein [Adhaeribacter terreus]|uniref:Uncharacterized protein n=1 Tax=Adhaeribacter terreus TaxID=529703 RepID=A0ABW0EED8_9BACT